MRVYDIYQANSSKNCTVTVQCESSVMARRIASDLLGCDSTKLTLTRKRYHDDLPQDGSVVMEELLRHPNQRGYCDLINGKAPRQCHFTPYITREEKIDTFLAHQS